MATQQTRDGLEYIIQAITNIVEPKVDTLKYDKTYRAKVTAKIDEGVYKVQIAGIEYQLSYGGTLNVGDIVKVKAPLNNFSDIYIEALPGSGGGGGGTTNYNDLTNKPILNTNITTAQTPNASEIIKGTISLHKVSKTGNYSDLNNLPSLNFIPTSQKGAANGVAELDSNVKVPKAQLPSDTVYDSNYVHTDKNFTDALNTKLNGIEAGAQVNIIDTIQKNGTVLPISNKTVNVTVPTKTSDLTNDGASGTPFISSIPIASTSQLGGIKVGANLTIAGDGTLSAVGGGGGGTVSDTLPIGSVVEWYSDYVPDNWLICNGQAISRTVYSDLFAVLGTKYGSGDGTSTFNLPDMKSRFPVGYNSGDTDFNELGKLGGSKTQSTSHTHTIAGHSHTVNAHRHDFRIGLGWFYGAASGENTTAGNAGAYKYSNSSWNGWNGAGFNTTARVNTGTQAGYNDQSSGVQMSTGDTDTSAPGTNSVGLTTNTNTTATTVNVLPPYFTVNYLIKAKQTQAVVATVVDNLTSTSVVNALSANQGRILNNNKLESSNIIQGNNITITKSGKDCTINAVVPTQTSDLTNNGADGTSTYVEKDELGTAATKNVGTASGQIPTLDSNGKLPEGVIPASAITEVFVVNSQSAMLALTAQPGDVAVRTDINKSFILKQTPASTLSNWVELLTPLDSVTSVNGETGSVVLTSDNINVGTTTQTITQKLTELTNAISSAGKRYTTTIGNGTATSFVVTHNLNSANCIVQVSQAASPYSVVIPDIALTNNNSCTISFREAPSTNEFKVNIIG